MNLIPRNEYVVCRPQDLREKHGGIIVPGKETEESLMTVVAVGPGPVGLNGQRQPIEIVSGMPLRPNDSVYVRGGQYDTFTDDQKRQCFIVPQSMILAVEKL